MTGSADDHAIGDDRAAAGYRPLLFSITYGMTGSVGDAEDIVQDALLGLTRARQAGTVIADLKAVPDHGGHPLGINYLSSARVRRETYVGDWLPEPVVVPVGEPGPAEHAELADSLSMAFLVLLEALSPVERAVFMLREVFGYDYPAVPRITGKTEVNCRQIFARARQRIAAGEPLIGQQRVLRLIGGLFRRARVIGAYARLAWVNGQPGAVSYDAQGRVINVIELDIADGMVQAIRSVVNPDKLRHLGPVSDVALLQGRQRPQA